MIKRRESLSTSLIVLSLALLTAVFPAPVPNLEKQVVGSGERADEFRLTLAATEDENGVDGQATFVDTYKNAKLKLDIIDISIVSTDRIAQLVGVVTSTTGGTFAHFPTGEKVTFFVEDNGEGNDSIPDGFSLPNEKPGKPKPGGSTFPEVVHGNFRVTGTSDKGEVIEVPK